MSARIFFKPSNLVLLCVQLYKGGSCSCGLQNSDDIDYYAVLFIYNLYDKSK